MNMNKKKNLSNKSQYLQKIIRRNLIKRHSPGLCYKPGDPIQQIIQAFISIIFYSLTESTPNTRTKFE